MRLRSLALPLAGTILAAAVADAAPPRPQPAQALAGLDALIEKALADQKVPGVTVGVVVGDEVALLKGYGLRDRVQKLPMTPDTLMPIASVTKQFTVSALGTLVRQGKLDWDRPVRDYLPDFRVHDDYATLRTHGFSDEDIWDIGNISAFFCLSNRMANLINLRPNDEFFTLGRTPKPRS